MKAILEFDLDDFDDRAQHEMAIKGKDTYMALTKIKEFLWDTEASSRDHESFNDILYGYGINLDVLP